jgi:hypothetical protein
MRRPAACPSGQESRPSRAGGAAVFGSSNYGLARREVLEYVEKLEAARGEAPREGWRMGSSEADLPSGTPVEAGTTLYTFDRNGQTWLYDLPPIPSRSPSE